MRSPATADVIVEGFRPGVVASLGVDYDAVRAINPKIVYCALSGYGQTGPRAQRCRPRHQLSRLRGPLTARASAAARRRWRTCRSRTCWAARRARRSASSPRCSARTRSGRGRFVDVAMADAVLAHQIFLLGALEDDGIGRAARRGPADGRRALLRRLRDARRALARRRRTRSEVLECAVRNARTAGSRARPVRHGSRGQRGRARHWRQSSAAATLADWCARFAAVDCCVTPVLTFDEALADAQFAARAMVDPPA